MIPSTSGIVEGFDPGFIRVCYFGSFPGYRTTIVVHNPLPNDALTADTFHVAVTAFDGDGHLLGTTDELDILPPRGFGRLEIDTLIGPGRQIDTATTDIVGIVHLTPGRYIGLDTVDLPISDLYSYSGLADDLVEYRSEELGVVACVPYQSPPQNDRRVGGTRSTLMQSPKVLVGQEVDTVVQVLNVSTEPGYDVTVDFQVRICFPDGSPAAGTTVAVPAQGVRRISARDLLSSAGTCDAFIDRGGFGMIVGLSTGGSLVPLSFTRNDRSGGLAIDHTLPPLYYLPWWGGEVRKQASARVAATLFTQVEQ